MGDALGALERIYFSMQSSLSSMLAACQNQGERDQVLAKYVAARQNYWSCIGKAFHEDDPAVMALVKQAGDVADTLMKIKTHLGEIAKVLNVLTSGVEIGAALAAKVVAL